MYFQRKVVLQTSIITQLVRKTQGFIHLELNRHWPVVGLIWPVIHHYSSVTPGSSIRLEWTARYVILNTGRVTTLYPAPIFFSFAIKKVQCLLITAVWEKLSMWLNGVSENRHFWGTKLHETKCLRVLTSSQVKWPQH